MTRTHHQGVIKKGERIEMKVAGRSEAPKVAGAIASYLSEGVKVCLSAIGAGAVNQAVKAICLARGIRAQAGDDLYVVPAFSDETIDGNHRTGIKLFLHERER